MVAFFTLAMVAWFIIQQVLNDRKKEKWIWKKTESRWNRIILTNHFKWCVENGRDITWAKNVIYCSKADYLSSKNEIYYCADCEIERIAIRDPSIKLRVQRFGLDMPKRISRFIKATEIAIDLETKDPNIKTKGPGWATFDGHIVGFAVAALRAAMVFPYSS